MDNFEFVIILLWISLWPSNFDIFFFIIDDFELRHHFIMNHFKLCKHFIMDHFVPIELCHYFILDHFELRHHFIMDNFERRHHFIMDHLDHFILDRDSIIRINMKEK